MLVVAPLAQAKPGALDKSFGDSGRSATAADLGSSWKDALIHLATFPDSSTVVASARQLFRYLPDGQLDPGFGAGGKVTLEQIEGLSFRFSDIAIDGAGRIVAFGTAEDLGVTANIPLYTPTRVHPTYAVVLRYDATGGLDPSFGGGDGIVRTDLGLPHPLEAEGGSRPPLVRGLAGVVDSQERPVLLAEAGELVAGEGHSGLMWIDRALARLTSVGDLDPSFGEGDGVALLNGTHNRGVAPSPGNGPLFVWGGFPTDQPEPVTRVTALNAVGTTDALYGSAGTRTIHGGGGDAALDRFGRLLILELPDFKPAHVLRLKPSGELDRSFGRGGHATLKLPSKGSAVSSIATDTRGRVLVAGTAVPPLAGRPDYGEPGRFMIVTRLLPSGKTDRRFGHNGWTRVGFGRRTKIASAHEVVSDLQGWGIGGPQAAIDSYGRLVVAAPAHSPQLQPGGVVLARYLMGR